MDCQATAEIPIHADGTISVQFGGYGDFVAVSTEVISAWVETHNTLLAERDRARDIAVALEQELAEAVALERESAARRVEAMADNEGPRARLVIAGCASRVRYPDGAPE